MTKELEEIRDDKLRIGLLGLKRIVEANKGKLSRDEIMAFDFTFMNITNALLELQAIKEAEPSEALACLRTLGNEEIATTENEPYYYKKLNYVYEEDFTIIEQALLKAEKLEKAWGIIKEKDVDMFMLKRFKTLKGYNNYAKDNKMKELTKEEFDLLKEALV